MRDIRQFCLFRSELAKSGSHGMSFFLHQLAAMPLPSITALSDDEAPPTGDQQSHPTTEHAKKKKEPKPKMQPKDKKQAKAKAKSKGPKSSTPKNEEAAAEPPAKKRPATADPKEAQGLQELLWDGRKASLGNQAWQQGSHAGNLAAFMSRICAVRLIAQF